MPFSNAEIRDDEPHRWALVLCDCDLEDPADRLVTRVAEDLRSSYGSIEELLRGLEPGAAEELSFQTERLERILRKALPDSGAEGDKPPQLTNFRAEVAETVAKSVLAAALGIEFPAHPQMAKLRRSQPTLGYDGWGFVLSTTPVTMVLVQVKGTDQDASPPKEAKVLAEECVAAPRDENAIIAALSLLAVVARGTDFQAVAVKLLLAHHDGDLPIWVGPVVVRGMVEARFEDLDPVREAVRKASLVARGAVVRVGSDLTAFGRAVCEKARVA